MLGLRWCTAGRGPVLSSLHQEVHSPPVRTVERKAAVGCGMPPHDADIGPKALQVHNRVGRHLCRPQVLPRHLHICEGLLLGRQTASVIVVEEDRSRHGEDFCLWLSRDGALITTLITCLFQSSPFTGLESHGLPSGIFATIGKSLHGTISATLVLHPASWCTLTVWSLAGLTQIGWRCGSDVT